MSEEEKDLINLKISISPEKYIKELLKENQELKKELETYNKGCTELRKIIEHKDERINELKKQLEEKIKIGVADHKYASKCEDKVITMENQQKEFIKWLEDNWNTTQDIWYIKILNKYKEIIGSDINVGSIGGKDE